MLESIEMFVKFWSIWAKSYDCLCCWIPLWSWGRTDFCSKFASKKCFRSSYAQKMCKYDGTRPRNRLESIKQPYAHAGPNESSNPSKFSWNFDRFEWNPTCTGMFWIIVSQSVTFRFMKKDKRVWWFWVVRVCNATFSLPMSVCALQVTSLQKTWGRWARVAMPGGSG